MAGVEGSADTTLVIFPKAGAQLFEPVNRVIQQQQWQVNELHVERGRLDEVFRTITKEVA